METLGEKDGVLVGEVVEAVQDDLLFERRNTLQTNWIKNHLQKNVIERKVLEWGRLASSFWTVEAWSSTVAVAAAVDSQFRQQQQRQSRRSGRRAAGWV